MMYQGNISNAFNITLGISPRFTHQEISDIVVQDFKIRELVGNGEENAERNFTETALNQQQSDNFFEIPSLAGIAFIPSNMVKLKLSTSPVIFKKDRGLRSVSNWQGFVSLAITPIYFFT